jgi:protein phosphatase
VYPADRRPHTITAELIRQGVLRAKAAADHPYRHVVTNLLGGSEPGVNVELHRLDLNAGDVLLLCSDGLTEMVSDDQIAAVLWEEPEPRCAYERLVARAIDQGGTDNVTVVVARIEAAGRQPLA